MTSRDQPVNAEPAFFRLCSSCRRPLAFGSRYYACCVSPCNRAKTALTFCSLPCFQAHVPVLRHRDAWAEEKRAPTQAAFEAEQKAQKPEPKDEGRRHTASAPKQRTTNEEPPMSNEVASNEVLIVVSKVKAYIKARAGMNTSDAVSEAISDLVRRTCDDAIARAKSDGRKTVMPRDVSGGSDPAG